MEGTTDDTEKAIMRRLQELKADTDLDFMKEFLASAPKQMEEDFLHLSTAIRQQNTKERMFHAHKIKGLLLTIGADDAAALCMKLETTPDDGKGSDVTTLFATLEINIEQVRHTLTLVAPKILES